jgi:glycerophosphoryl diester phosphodiesterase
MKLLRAALMFSVFTSVLAGTARLSAQKRTLLQCTHLANCRKIKGAGKKVIVWTVNDPADMQRFAECGVDGIISDDTALLCRTLVPSS